MVLSRFEYDLQAKKARAAIVKIEEKINLVKNSLFLTPECPTLRRELRNLTLDMTITINELEHAESALEHLNQHDVSSATDNAEYSR